RRLTFTLFPYTTLFRSDVFTRLQPSQIHGVGVFAIQEIPEGKYIFDPDSTDLITIRSKTVDHLPDAAKQLYKDFCVLRGDRYLRSEEHTSELQSLAYLV